MIMERSQAELLLIQILVREQRIWRYLSGDNRKGKQGRFLSARTQLRHLDKRTKAGCRFIGSTSGIFLLAILSNSGRNRSARSRLLSETGIRGPKDRLSKLCRNSFETVELA